MTLNNINEKTHVKRNLTILGLVVAVAILGIYYAPHGEALLQPQVTSPAVSFIGMSPFDFELPNEAVDGKRYDHVREGGTPEAVIQKGTTVVLPIIIRPAGNEKATINFSTTFGEQLDAPKMPPGIHVTVEPNTIVLQPGHDSVINMVVQVDKNAPDGTYMQNIVGTWGGPNDFLGSAVSLKIGSGSQHYLFPGDVGQ
jgi:hypothetical protein